MLDPKRIRSEPDLVREACRFKKTEVDLDRWLLRDERRRQILVQVETLKAEKNRATEEIGKAKKAGKDAAEAVAAMKKVGDEIKALDEHLAEIEAELTTLHHWIPNIPHVSVPRAEADGNVVVRTVGAPTKHAFEAKPHWELATSLRLLDFDRANKIAGGGFLLFTGKGARLERALINFMLDLHTTKHGYTEVSPPHLVRRQSLFGTGQLPKLEEDMYRLADEDLFLNPTAEVPVTNIHQDEILDGARLPIYLTAHCASYRREAGSYGRDTRGMIRVHQFDKVELVKFTTPETSYDEHEKLLKDAEDVLLALELPYRVVLLAAGDMSFAAAKCYDLETWAPGEARWLEVSSCSNFEDFQARRSGIRFRPPGKGAKVDYVHTLNASGLALPRVFATILEHYQTEAGTVRIPDVLVPYLGGLRELTPG
ncbi:MAG TPA: serine--tRNA ligase [Candidatus Eisenbacteria bacterium]|nr:serine--tRNA ligase [Candidatus Eisenbacteria bacterium]